MPVSRIALVAALATFAATPIRAADEGASPIIVVGQADASVSFEPRGPSINLGQDQFDGINAQNVEDLLKYAPDFFVRKRYSGDPNGIPVFRGTHSGQSARTLVMVDGFAISNFLGNSYAFAPKWGVVGPREVEQIDVAYGPFSARYPGNSMGGVVNISTLSPQETEAFAAVQGMAQTYDQYGTHDTYLGWSGEAGMGWRQKDGPWSIRLSGRHFRNEGQPMSWYGLSPATGDGAEVTGAVVDPEQAIPNAPGTPANPIFAAQSPATATQDQFKLRLGYDGSAVAAKVLVAYWHDIDEQYTPDCYLRDEADGAVCEGLVTVNGSAFNASGARLSRTVRDELLAGFELSAPLADAVKATLNASTYQIARSDSFISAGYAAGKNDGAGTLARQGPTGWLSGGITLDGRWEGFELSAGVDGNLYRTDLSNYTLPNWRNYAGATFSSRTFGKTRLLSGWAEAGLPLGEWAATFGVRYENWRAFDGGLGRLGTGPQAGQKVFNAYPARSETALDPKLSVEWRRGDTSAQLSLAEATRFPTVGELYQGSLNGDGSFNPDSFDADLRPERSRDANFLLAHDFGAVKLTGSLFWQRTRDTIFSFLGFNQNGVTTSSFKNIDVARQYGAELIAEVRDLGIEGLAIDGNLAWIDSRIVRNDSAPAAEGVQFPRVPRWRIAANARYAITPDLLAAMGLRYASRPNTDLFGLQRGDTFGYTSELFALDARVNWQAKENLRLSAGVDNITNNKAWVYHPYPQRSFVIEAGWAL